MPNDNLVLIDTSVWIDYLQKNDSKFERTVDSLLENGRAATAAIILAELTQGAKNEKEIDTLKNYFQPLTWIESRDEHWKRAGELAFRLRQKGKTINLTDCYIAALAHQSSATILSLDKHFEWISDSRGCTLFEGSR